MNDVTPTRAYDLLEAIERDAVDDYVKYAVAQQKSKCERIIHALYMPIPSEYIRRSKQALYKPVVLAAIREKIQEAADEQDLSPSRVIREHAAIAFATLSDYLVTSGFGDLTVKDINSISPDKMGAVKSIETKPGPYGMATKIVLHDKLPSLKALGEMMGIVASDRPPVLQEYVKPNIKDDTRLEQVPEVKYMKLLEQVN